MPNIINNKAFKLTLLLLLCFVTPVQTPQLGSDDPLSPKSDLTPLHSSPPADNPSPADAPFAENVKSEERKESGSGGIVVGVVVALCVVVLGHLRNNNRVNRPHLLGIMPDNLPERLRELRNIRFLNFCAGYNCAYGYDVATNRMWAVIWHATNAAEVPIEIDVTPDYDEGYTHSVLSFGGQAKFGKMSVKENPDGRPTRWDVDVFSVSTRDWTNVHRDMQPFELCKMECSKVCENGRVVYFRAFDLPVTGYRKDRSNFFISFDVETRVFGKVPLPRSLENTDRFIQTANLNGSLGLFEYRDGVCDVWIKRAGANDTFFWRTCNSFGVNETFTKIGTLRVEGHYLYGDASEFWNNPAAIWIGVNRWHFVWRLI